MKVQIFPPRVPRPSSTPRRVRLALLCSSVCCCSAALADPPVAGPNLGDLSLEELMNETVTSVSKREQKLTDAAAAVTVLTNDDIRRSGVTSVADALRLVPGMSVGSVNANQWAVSARGFNGLYANKLLVLVDGRAVYSPNFAGVYWDAEQTMLEDVDRIEVIRGPGATVWGANAVNGVVNIVTRGARETQGDLLYGSFGDVQEARVGARHGGRLGEKTYYRVYAGAQSTDDYPLASGQDAGDGWSGQHGGVRIDHHPDDDTQVTWLAGTTGVDTDDDQAEAYNLNTLGRLTRRWADRSSLEIQAYYDQTVRNELQRARIRSDTIDLSAQHTFGLGERNDVIWGLGYRFIDSSVEQTTPLLKVRDGEVQTDLFSFFLQDEFRLVPDKFTVSAGVKVEHNDYTGVEVQPSLSGVVTISERQTAWAAVSRAVRTPASVEERDVFGIVNGAPIVGPDGGLYLPRIVGNSDVSSEILWAYELGYRIQPTKRVSVDVAVFYNVYDDLISVGEISAFVPGVPLGTAEIPFANTLGGETRGGEIAVTFSPTDTWRLTANYSLLIAKIDGPESADPDALEDGSPRNQALLRTSHDLTRRLHFDAQLRFVDSLRFVPAYLTADLRIAYQATDRLEISLVGQNLLQDQHPEQGPAFFTTTSEVPRGFYARLVWQY
ncbi:MAG: TonB-dependent receptor [Burkholderiales bacterium]|nr:TonB-dependent receptor [Opitutaceae bacterium]